MTSAEFLKGIGRIAGWDKQHSIQDCRCGNGHPDFYTTGFLGLGPCQFECSSCKTRGLVAHSYGGAVGNWNYANEFNQKVKE